jgi:uncharacterized protein (DUF427 family)
MKTPGPDHPVSIARNPMRVRAQVAGHVIADTMNALTLTEGDLAPVQYFPRKDVETGFLSQTDFVSESEYKGSAVHYSLWIDGELLENAAWSYEDPFPAAEGVQNLIAFDPAQVRVYEVDDEALRQAERL